jgi:transcriptional regulator with XRE-family HTH domain
VPLQSATVGERIALHRRRRGLDQAQLARLLGRSPYWLSQVERGLRSIDRASVLAHVATVLRVPVAELAGESVLSDERERESKLTAAVRSALSAYPALKAVKAGPRADLPESLLRVEVNEAWDLLHRGAQEELIELLGGLLAKADIARSRQAVPAAQRPRLASEIYQLTAALLGQLGEGELALVAADRALSAAYLTGDPLVVAASAFRVAHAFLGSFRPEQAQQVALDAAGALTGDDPATVSLNGALTLVAALACAQRQDHDSALACLSRAESAAALVGPSRNDAHTEFGPENVGLHAVTVAVEFGDPRGALDRAAQVDSSGLSPERCARLLIDMARAHAQLGDARAALEALAEAEAVAPELIRAHDLVRELLRELLVAGDPDARAYARALGILGR